MLVNVLAIVKIFPYPRRKLALAASRPSSGSRRESQREILKIKEDQRFARSTRETKTAETAEALIAALFAAKAISQVTNEDKNERRSSFFGKFHPRGRSSELHKLYLPPRQ